ncbi:MAG: glycosyltransferase [Gloeocapsa sp. DLM2.Bin57]|nr:MAG: glycosyltransferase [Gloeocapsa sp. DLM2.Bin57]
MLIVLILVCLSLLIWVILLTLWGNFWLCNQRLDSHQQLESYPTVCGIIPARNEAEVIESSLQSLLLQNYPSCLRIVLIDDQSQDNTGNLAQNLAKTLNQEERLTVISGQPLPIGWTGKLWAMEQGINYAMINYPEVEYFFFTDADIQHGVNTLTELVNQAKSRDLALVSLMVKLRCESFWEKLLIPAFVFFFQQLYPFPWVNQPKRSMAAAAGGCILLKRETLTEIGGIGVLKDALIDDCTLAQKVKSRQYPIWLGLTETSLSLRPYDSLQTIWDMVARTAYTQLNYSGWLLVGTVVGMIIVYLLPPIGLILGIVAKDKVLIIFSVITWLLMAVAYLPTVKLYQGSFWRAFSLPVIAFLYTLMTIDSAWRHWRGKGGAWKGRIYPQN